MKHTPGPWIADGLTIFSDIDRPIASTKETPVSDEEAKANARLIAASPEMLKALEVILKELERDVMRLSNSLRRGDQSLGYTLSFCRARAIEAIAKASGGV